ncbi:MAG: hypothetical protein LBJ80_00190 [Rickettsiales bacterium]|jgi:hypothetical protein|nr:hypothetical protein [Rickettsiales bacterium]
MKNQNQTPSLEKEEQATKKQTTSSYSEQLDRKLEREQTIKELERILEKAFDSFKSTIQYLKDTTDMIDHECEKILHSSGNIRSAQLRIAGKISEQLEKDFKATVDLCRNYVISSQQDSE